MEDKLIEELKEKAGMFHERDGNTEAHIEWNDNLGDLFHADDVYPVIQKQKQHYEDAIAVNRSEVYDEMNKLVKQKDKEIKELKSGLNELMKHKDAEFNKCIEKDDKITELKQSHQQKIKDIFDDFDKFHKKYDFWMTDSKIDKAYKQLNQKHKAKDDK